MSAKDTEDQAREAFTLYDKRGGGSIPKSSLGDVLRALGQNPTQGEVNNLNSQINDDITFNTFMNILNRPNGWDPAGTEDDFIKGFSVFDKEGSGFIGVEELRYVLTALGEKLSNSEVDDLLKGVKVTNEGNINYVDFVRSLLASP